MPHIPRGSGYRAAVPLAAPVATWCTKVSGGASLPSGSGVKAPWAWVVVSPAFPSTIPSAFPPPAATSTRVLLGVGASFGFHAVDSLAQICTARRVAPGACFSVRSAAPILCSEPIQPDESAPFCRQINSMIRSSSAAELVMTSRSCSQDPAAEFKTPRGDALGACQKQGPTARESAPAGTWTANRRRITRAERHQASMARCGDAAPAHTLRCTSASSRTS